MRPIERIDNFLQKVNWDKLAERWNCELLHGCTPEFNISKETLDYWKKNPDQRIGQVFINLGLILDSLKIWNDEESDILASQGLPPEEYLYWTSLYDKDDVLLDQPITRLIKDLETSHIKAILKLCYKNLSEDYKKAFDNTLQKYLSGVTYDIETSSTNNFRYGHPNDDNCFESMLQKIE